MFPGKLKKTSQVCNLLSNPHSPLLLIHYTDLLSATTIYTVIEPPVERFKRVFLSVSEAAACPTGAPCYFPLPLLLHIKAN